MFHENFNLEIKNEYWITDIGHLEPLDKSELLQDEISYQTLDGHTFYSGFKCQLPTGKYSVSIKGFSRKEKQGYPHSDYGYLLTFEKIEQFEGCRDPREDEIYDFNVANMRNDA